MARSDARGGQNGKPLRQATIQEYVEGFGKEKFQGKTNVQWTPNDDYTRLTAFFYVENIFTCVKFIEDLYNLDSETMKQIPGVQILDQDIFKVELHTPKLKGLSYKDLELASMINGFDFTKYKLTPMDDLKQVRRIKRQQQIEAENAQIQDEIAKSAYKFGSKKFRQVE
eukprot:CAMPEP_0197005388 /NCGR_PEP_ID=MMETSP1380-20130617/29125_1 /TAXON_ID=5936 /ORGANISM="Euplotes crassus, Strain CT5" /LENGTH=168 /DNA_ID=CAMNT_0042424515 /DNA_START=97 /DNA_END=602 /DNA_ORIENTATION=-